MNRWRTCCPIDGWPPTHPIAGRSPRCVSRKGRTEPLAHDLARLPSYAIAHQQSARQGVVGRAHTVLGDRSKRWHAGLIAGGTGMMPGRAILRAHWVIGLIQRLYDVEKVAGGRRTRKGRSCDSSIPYPCWRSLGHGWIASSSFPRVRLERLRGTPGISGRR